jgi:hypothetical protein
MTIAVVGTRARFAILARITLVARATLEIVDRTGTMSRAGHDFTIGTSIALVAYTGTAVGRRIAMTMAIKSNFTIFTRERSGTKALSIVTQATV